jgi:myosin-1
MVLKLQTQTYQLRRLFQDNSFEQLCINYVNEKLQQIFIELTLKTEQEEYVREQIKWTPIKYFNNKIVCDLIEEKRPPGIFAALNDACATAHADPSAADNSFVQRTSMLASNAHFEARGAQFLVRHYAGDVMYNVAGMTDKNKDSLVKDLLDLVAGSGNQFLLTLFPDRVDPNSKKRPPTAGDRIKVSSNFSQNGSFYICSYAYQASAGALVENLMKARPSYIRTIKPNQNRSSSEYDSKAILHQIKYLGLQENIRVRRAGFAYRNTFEKMVERFYLLSPATSYAGEYTWSGDARSGCQQILKDTGIAADEWQMGVTKAFIKNPETVSQWLVRCDGISSQFSFSLSRQCGIGIGTIWRVVSSGRSAITCGTNTNAPVVFKGFGRTMQRASNMLRLGITDIKYSLVEKSGDVSVFSATVGLWAITSMSTVTVHLGRN